MTNHLPKGSEAVGGREQMGRELERLCLWFTGRQVRPKEEREWPVVDVVAPPAWMGQPLWTCPVETVTDFPSMTYHPESAPNVLSPEEAHEIAEALRELGWLPEIWDRLSTYAKDQS